MSKIYKFLSEHGYYNKMPTRMSNLSKFAEDDWRFTGEDVPESLLGRIFKSKDEAIDAAKYCDFKYY
jgi:hypothetical protein